VLEELKKAILGGLESFKDDPADSDHQRGYEAALQELKRIMDKHEDRVDVI